MVLRSLLAAPLLTALLLSAQGGLVTQAAADPSADDAVRQAFAAADLDGDGVVDEAELVNDTIVGFVAADRDADGMVSAAELDAQDRAAIGNIDEDGDGQLVFGEVIARKLAQFEAADTNGDGALSLDEALAIGGAK